ncbi:hypothetical protein Tco_0859280 [Tanacetum coccineum]|uniref:Uncharacterized protein n=1 Tax=Tanacetum coccineum TaxID=301880 RepID=A0ABQ5BEI9_9ASTR
MDEEETNKEEEANELYRDVNVNFEERDTEMIDALLANVQTTQVIEDTHVIITAATPEVQQQNVPVTPNVEMPPSFVTTLPPPPIHFIQPQQQTPFSTPTIVPSTSLQNLPTFDSVFKFEDRVKALEDDFSEFKQTNQVAAAVSSIPDIIDTYLANKMNEVVKTVVQLLSDKHRSEAQANNEDKTLYKALVDAYETDKDILETYGGIVTFKRRRDDKDEDEEPSVGSNRGSKRRRARKEPESTSAPKEKTSKSSSKSKEGSKSYHTSNGKFAQTEEPIHAFEDLEEPTHQEFDIGFTKDQPVDETTQHLDCRTYATSVIKTKAADYRHIKWIEDFILNLMWSQVPIVYDKHALWGISHWGRKRQQFYEFVVNREYAHDVYSKHRILNKDKKNRLMRIDELHKFSDSTINDVWSFLDDILKRIRMEYLPKTVWRNVDSGKIAGSISKYYRQTQEQKRRL